MIVSPCLARDGGGRGLLGHVLPVHPPRRVVREGPNARSEPGAQRGAGHGAHVRGGAQPPRAQLPLQLVPHAAYQGPTPISKP